VSTRAVVGIMLHHAVTNADELEDVDALLKLIAASPHTRLTTIAAEAERVSAPPARS
jgi:hypothetical protein